MKLSQTIGFLGTGNMAEALIKGLLHANVVEPSQIFGADPRSERNRELADRYQIHTSTKNLDVVKQSDILVLSVKPQILAEVCREIAPHVKPSALVISIAAGISTATLAAQLPSMTRIVRTMPNMPALVGAGATAISAGSHATLADLEIARQIFAAIGMAVVVDEIDLDAVTGLSGSGPAYVFLIIEALSDAGVKVGLSREVAQALASQTVLGSAKLLLETKEHPGRLKDMVTSPGGTAIAGLHTLEAGGLRTTLINAVEAATKRSRELGAPARQDQ